MKFSHQSLLAAAALAIGGFIGASSLVAFAGTWTAAPSTPPTNNVDAPINVGDLTQWKTGLLGLSKLEVVSATNGLFAYYASTTPGQLLTAADTSGTIAWSDPITSSVGATYIGDATENVGGTRSVTAGVTMNLPDDTSLYNVLIHATYFNCQDRPVSLILDSTVIGNYRGKNSDTSGCDQNTVIGVATVSSGPHTLKLSSDNGSSIIQETHYSWIAGTTLGITDSDDFPLARIQVNIDEGVVLSIKGTTVTIVSQTSGASILSKVFQNVSTGLPSDGKALVIHNLISNNKYASLLSACPNSTATHVQAINNKGCILQQPSAANSYTTKVWLYDAASDNHKWRFDLDYQ